MQLINKPRKIDASVYQSCIEKLSRYLAKDDAIHSVYQMGNVNHPGISDLDFIVVLKGDVQSASNPLSILSLEDKYLITHEIGGISLKDFPLISAYTFWDNLKCLSGHDLSNQLTKQDPKTKSVYSNQLALEYLNKNYIEVSIQLTYGIIKQRTILQEIKGVRYDVNILGLEGTELDNSVKKFLHWLDHWFEDTPDERTFITALKSYHEALEKALIDLNNLGNLLWLPKVNRFKYGKNVLLHASDKLDFKKNGIYLPSSLIARHRKFYNAHLRINNFEFFLPITHQDQTGVLEKRYKDYKRYKKQMIENFPQFGPMIPGILNRFI